MINNRKTLEETWAPDKHTSDKMKDCAVAQDRWSVLWAIERPKRWACGMVMAGAAMAQRIIIVIWTKKQGERIRLAVLRSDVFLDFFGASVDPKQPLQDLSAGRRRFFGQDLVNIDGWPIDCSVAVPWARHITCTAMRCWVDRDWFIWRNLRINRSTNLENLGIARTGLLMKKLYWSVIDLEVILIIHTQLILSFVEVNSLCNSKGVSEHAGRLLPFNVIYLKVSHPPPEAPHLQWLIHSRLGPHTKIPVRLQLLHPVQPRWVWGTAPSWS